MILMCKNIPVYDVDTEQVYYTNLLPGLMLRNPCNDTFFLWLKTRYSANTNTLARKLKGVVFGQGNRLSINKSTHALSLSDCYWVREPNFPYTFEQISPYYVDFWKGDGYYNRDVGGAIPTLYVGGYLNKEWVSANHLHKYGNDLGKEVEVYRLCKECGISVNRITPIKKGICIENFTSPDKMLEQADQSGLVDAEDFTEVDIIRLFGIGGVQMLIIDAITGNGDRHAGNFGWLRDANTGKYISMAPLYDFDHALDSTLSIDRLIIDAVEESVKAGYLQEVERIANIISKVDTVDIFKVRAVEVLKLL